MAFKKAFSFVKPMLIASKVRPPIVTGVNNNNPFNAVLQPKTVQLTTSISSFTFNGNVEPVLQEDHVYKHVCHLVWYQSCKALQLNVLRAQFIVRSFQSTASSGSDCIKTRMQYIPYVKRETNWASNGKNIHLCFCDYIQVQTEIGWTCRIDIIELASVPQKINSYIHNRAPSHELME